MFSIRNCIHINTEKNTLKGSITRIKTNSRYNHHCSWSLWSKQKHKTEPVSGDDIFFCLQKIKLPHSIKKNHKIHVFTVQNYGNHVSYPIDVKNALEIRPGKKISDVFGVRFPRKFRNLHCAAALFLLNFVNFWYSET